MRNRFLALFGYAIIYGLVFWQLLEVQILLREQAAATYRPLAYMIYSTVLPVILGLLAAVPNLVRMFRARGSWRYDWAAILAVGIPALIGAAYAWLYYSPVGVYLPLPQAILTENSPVRPICGFVLGYLLLHSVQKRERGER